MRRLFALALRRPSPSPSGRPPHSARHEPRRRGALGSSPAGSGAPPRAPRWPWGARPLAGLLLLLLAITACAGPIQQRGVNWNDAQDITTWMTMTRDEYKKMIRVQGPAFGTEGASAMLRAWRPDGSSGSTDYQIYVKSCNCSGGSALT